jgi:hypothetical protein
MISTGHALSARSSKSLLASRASVVEICNALGVTELPAAKQTSTDVMHGTFSVFQLSPILTMLGLVLNVLYMIIKPDPSSRKGNHSRRPPFTPCPAICARFGPEFQAEFSIFSNEYHICFGG